MAGKEFAPVAGGYEFGTHFGENLRVLYTYTEKDPYIETHTISYTYEDGVSNTKRVFGSRAAATQEIMNNLPMWMDMRQRHKAVGQDLVHAWGHHLEEANSLYNEYRTDQFLGTANVYNDVHMGVSELSFNEEKVYSSDLRNILFNSSFSMLAHGRVKRPQGWAVSRNDLRALSYSPENAVFGNHALQLNGLYGSVDIKQKREFKALGGSLTFSIYIKTVDNGIATTKKYEASEAGILLTLQYADNTVKTFGVGFPQNTEHRLARTSLTATVEKELYSVEVSIVNRTNMEFFVDLPMLQVGGKPTHWTPSANDIPIYISSGVRTVTAVQATTSTPDGSQAIKYEVLPLVAESEFSEVRVPTRILPFSPKSEPAHKLNMALKRQVNFWGETQPTYWPVTDDKVRESSLSTNDVFGDVLPADLYMDMNGDLFLDMTMVDTPAAISVKATTVVDNLLYMVTQETYAGTTGYYLKFVRPEKVNYEDTFLESLADIELPLQLGSKFGIGSKSEDIIRIGVCDNIPNCIFLDTNLNRRLYFKLVYDYYYADFSKRKLFCREKYVSENANLQVI